MEFGKPPRAVLRIDIKEAYFHCGKALMRSKLWSAGETRVERAVMPSIGEVIHDQTGLGEPESQEVWSTSALQDAFEGGVSRRCAYNSILVSGILDDPPARDDDLDSFPRSRSVLALELAHMLLGVELEPDALDQVELGFEEIDVMLLVLHQLLEQVA